MILSVTVNPSVDHALFVEEIKLGDTNRVLRVERDAGGKGVNLSRVAAELGAGTIATGFIAGAAGDYVKGALSRRGVHHAFVEVEGETRVNFSVEDRLGNPPTTFNERGPDITPQQVELLFTNVRRLLPNASWMALGGSLPPGVPTDIFAQLTKLAHSAGVRVLVDADGECMRCSLDAAPDLIKPNAKEISRLVGRLVEDVQDAAVAATELHQKLQARNASDPIVVVSLGELGAVMASGTGTWRGYSPPVEARSTIGSGDSMNAGLLWALESGKTLEEAFRWGLAAGAATAATDGSDIARKPQIEELYPLARVETI